MTLPDGFRWLKRRRPRACRHGHYRVLLEADRIRLLECSNCRHKWKEIKEK